jgi:S1-C subfamily serine protease
VRRSTVVALALALSATIGAAAGAIAARTSDVEPDRIVTSATGPALGEAAGHGDASIPAVVAAVAPSVARIEATVESPPELPGELTAEVTGTGFVIRSDGYIATAAHVVDGAWSTWIVLADGERLPARVVAVDEATDLAVLTVDRDDLVPVAFGRTSEVRVGEDVIAVGYALDLGASPTVSVGVLSAVERTLAGTDGARFDHLLQTDAAINTGSSGGPLLNARGEVIGINTSRITDDDAEGLGFAICTDHALPVLEELAGI